MLLGSLPRAALPIAFEGETVASYCSRIDRATGAPVGHLWRIAAAEYRTAHKLEPHARIPSDTAERTALELCRRVAWTQTSQLAAVQRPSATSWYACLICAGGHTVVIHPDFTRLVCSIHMTWTGPVTTPGRHPMGRVRSPGPNHSRPVALETARAADRIHLLHPSRDVLWTVLRRAASVTRAAWDGNPAPEDLPLAAAILETVADPETVAAVCDYSKPYRDAYEWVRRRMAGAANPSGGAGVDQAWLMLRWTAAAARYRWAGEWNTEDPAPLIEPKTLNPPADRTLQPFEAYLDCLSENSRTDELWWDDRFRQVADGRVRCLCPAGHVLKRRAPKDHRHPAYDGSCGLCSGHRVVAGYNSFADYYPWLAQEWDDSWVSGPTPWTSSRASNRMGHWVCPAGHHYPATFQNRALRGSGCPFCAKKKVLPGFNDLATTHGELARLWSPNAGNPKTPEEISAGNCTDRMTWRCPRGHLFIRTPQKLVMTHGQCQTCRGKILIRGVNDLATMRGDVAAQWHPTKNGMLTPADVKPGSETLVWWMCPDGHEFDMRICDRCRYPKLTCPIETGHRLLIGVSDLATREPRLVLDWNSEKNECGPHEVVPGSCEWWWTCAFGHTQHRSVVNRRRAGGCTACPPRMRVAKPQRLTGRWGNSPKWLTRVPPVRERQRQT